MGSLIGGAAASNKFSASAPAINQQNLSPWLNTAQSTVMGNIGDQQALAQQLQNQANGQGPNPAQAQYQQNVNQNAQMQAGAIASQRGINPGLAARLIANNAANANQNAAGTAAVNQATQQQAALGQEANVYNNIGSQAAANQSTIQGAQANQNNAINTGQLGAQQINAGVSGENAGAANQLAGGLISGGSAALASSLGPAAAAAARGGEVPGKASVPGDSLQNDKVPYMLSPGEIVVPRTVAKQDPAKVAEFIAALKKQGPQKASTGARNDYSKVLESQRMMHQRLSQIEAMLKGGK